jgi:hypothetical protein
MSFTRNSNSLNFLAMSRAGSRQQKIHEVLNPRNVSPDDIKAKLLLRDRLQAQDTRTEAQRWLGDPPPHRSALARRGRRLPVDQEAARADAFRRHAIELANEARREDDYDRRRFLLDKARALVNVADQIDPPLDEPRLTIF